MNVFVFWLWMTLGCGAVTLALLRLIRSFARCSEAYPEEILSLCRPLDWESVKIAFDVDEAMCVLEYLPAVTARSKLAFRLSICREFIERMNHNAWLIIQCVKSDRRAFALMLKGRAEDRQTSDESDEEAEQIEIEDQIKIARLTEALKTARRFRVAAHLQLIKLDVLGLLINIDRFHWYPRPSFIGLWLRGSDRLLALYHHSKGKAAEYLSAYHERDDILASM